MMEADLTDERPDPLAPHAPRTLIFDTATPEDRGRVMAVLGALATPHRSRPSAALTAPRRLR